MGLITKYQKGIPVGPAFSIILAELTLNDLDRKVISNGYEFVRWVDDYFIFAKSYKELKILLLDMSAFLYGTQRWSGLFGQATGVYKWESALGSRSCRSLFLRFSAEVNHSRCLSVKVIMPSLFVVELEVAGHPVFHLRH